MKGAIAFGLVIAAFAASRVARLRPGSLRREPIGVVLAVPRSQLLKDRLFESLYYLHIQPPLFNLLLGVNLKLFPSRFDGAMHVEYLALGLTATIALFLLLRQLGLPALVSAVIASVFCVAPATLLYENWLFYEYPTMTWLLLAAVALHRFLARDSVAAGVGFFAAPQRLSTREPSSSWCGWFPIIGRCCW